MTLSYHFFKDCYMYKWLTLMLCLEGNGVYIQKNLKESPRHSLNI